MTDILFVFCLLVGYLIGSFPTGYWVARSQGVDIQSIGSGNIGATNVLRAVGVLPALIVVIADPLKGMLAVLLADLMGLNEWGLVLAGLAAVLGHSFNVFLGFKGGKGIATSLGVGLAIAPAAALAAAAIGLFTMVIGRYVSLGSLVGLVSAPLFLIMQPSFTLPQLFLIGSLAALAVIRHRENIVRLANGNERRIGEKAQVEGAKAASAAEPQPESRGA